MASTIDSHRLGGYITMYENVNFSTAKQKYSFGKGARFPSVNRKATDFNYNLPDTKSKRGAGFGIG